MGRAEHKNKEWRAATVDVPVQILVRCTGCGDTFRAFDSSVAAREKLCTPCASQRDAEPGT